MSVDAGLSICLVCRNGPRSILHALMRSRWQRHEDGWWCIPVHEDPAEWALLKGKEPADLASLFQARVSANQAFGLRLWWEGGEVGGEFLVFPSCELLFSPSMNRVTNGGRATDVTWYLSRLLPIFQQESGVAVESWVWRETG
jgi:hypothetical protein